MFSESGKFYNILSFIANSAVKMCKKKKKTHLVHRTITKKTFCQGAEIFLTLSSARSWNLHNLLWVLLCIKATLRPIEHGGKFSQWISPFAEPGVSIIVTLWKAFIVLWGPLNSHSTCAFWLSPVAAYGFQGSPCLCRCISLFLNLVCHILKWKIYRKRFNKLMLGVTHISTRCMPSVQA